MDLRPSFVRRHPNLRFGLSLRTGGVNPPPFGMNVSFRVGDRPEDVQRNRERFFKTVGCAQDQIAAPIQCHSANVALADGAGSYLDVDGLVTNRLDLYLTVTIADCIPIFLFDPKKTSVGVIHAGWRGSATGIVRNAVAKMEERFHSRPGDLCAHLGPAAHRCCYAVGTEVAHRFRKEVLFENENGMYLDLAKENSLQLLEAGLAADNIESSEYCTICNPGLFHSYRRDGQRSGRMMGILGITANTGG